MSAANPLDPHRHLLAPGVRFDHNLLDDLLVILTFGVVLFTLVAQGMTIAPLLRRLGVCKDGPRPLRSLATSPSASSALSSPDEPVPRTLGPVLDLAAKGQGLTETGLTFLDNAPTDATR